MSIQGSKQHGHLIARSDYISDHRKSVTIVTSSWSSGHGGPLGICVPDSFMPQKEVDQFNAEHLGEAMIFKSETSSHFMCGETFLVMLHGLVSPALMKQRQKLGVPRDTKALLLVDAWTGFHSSKTGLDAAREAWSQQACCLLPAVQVRIFKGGCPIVCNHVGK